MSNWIEYINDLRLLADAGLLVLIWLVQLIIYPGFQYYNQHQLFHWHKIYTPRITVVVAPLMFLQMGASLFLLFFEFSLLSFIYFILVLSTWLSTFLYFVPLHHNIETHTDVETSIKKLIRGNWMRTGQWTLIFIYGIVFFS
jgi:hypothetical protein